MKITARPTHLSPTPATATTALARVDVDRFDHATPRPSAAAPSSPPDRIALEEATVVLTAAKKIRVLDSAGSPTVALNAALANSVADGLSARLQTFADSAGAPRPEDVGLLRIAQRVREKMQGHLHRRTSVRPAARRLERSLIAAVLRRSDDLHAAGVALPPTSMVSKENRALASKWAHYGFEPEVFAAYPDFADAVLGSYLRVGLVGWSAAALTRSACSGQTS